MTLCNGCQWKDWLPQWLCSAKVLCQPSITSVVSVCFISNLVESKYGLFLIMQDLEKGLGVNIISGYWSLSNILLLLSYRYISWTFPKLLQLVVTFYMRWTFWHQAKSYHQFFANNSYLFVKHLISGFPGIDLCISMFSRLGLPEIIVYGQANSFSLSTHEFVSQFSNHKGFYLVLCER